jgi:pre-rRNA-processing protein TSR2
MATNTTNAMEEFRAGVTACLRSWSALRTAVESGWGGGERESQSKADVLRRNIFDIMNGSHCPIPNFDPTDLADNLAIYLEEEFSVTLEDNSEQQVADIIFRMYETCSKGDTSLAREMVAHANSAVAFSSQFPVQLQTTEHDDDDDDEDMADPQDVSGIQSQATTAAAPMQILVDYNSKPLFGEARKVSVSTGPVRQLGDMESVKEVEIEIDEDGFAPVKPKGRRKG